MVGDDAQLFTIEGFTAGLIMLGALYLVLNTAAVFVPGDTHIPDMQLEQLGNDALAMMDIPAELNGENALKHYVEDNEPFEFHKNLSWSTGYLQRQTGTTVFVPDIRYNATVYYRTTSGGVGSYHFADSDDYSASAGDLVGREPAVLVSRWVKIDNKPTGAPPQMRGNDQVVLLEVLLWRG